MAKKIIIAEDVMSSIKENISEANNKTHAIASASPVEQGNVKQTENTPASAINQKVDKILEALNTPKRGKRVGERSADRGSLAHVHITPEVKAQLEDMKSAMRMNGHSVTIDTIIFWSIKDFINRYYETFTLRDVSTRDSIKDDKRRQELAYNFEKFLRGLEDATE